MFSVTLTLPIYLLPDDDDCALIAGSSFSHESEDKEIEKEPIAALFKV
jgi:hypothetical protein